VIGRSSNGAEDALSAIWTQEAQTLMGAPVEVTSRAVAGWSMMLSMRVTVETYDSRWPRDYERIRHDLEAALREVDLLRIEHVGSTSVPGLAAKPILDIDVVVPADVVSSAIASLTEIGYQDEGQLGIPGRHSLRSPADGLVRHVYVCVEGCLALRNHIAVRDALRGDPDLRAEYGKAKLALGDRELEDMNEYVAGKNAVLAKILKRAGFSDAERSEIARMNPPTLD
jgi:GrpB-like predicted nucleotidyltransferase (UPF0157 family)